VAHVLLHRFWLRIESIRSCAVGRGRIDLRDVAILRVRWPLRQTCARCPRVALILGSGLGSLAERLRDVDELPFRVVPELPPTTSP